MLSRRGVVGCLLSACFVSALSPLSALGLGYIGTNFTGSNINQSGYIPPDTDGSVGPSHVVELLNGRYAVYNKSNGSQVSSSSLNTFFNNALSAAGSGSVTSYAYDPRVVYDRFSGRWFASAADNPGSANSLLLAVSNSSDPTAGWKGFKIDSDTTDVHWADFPTLGVDASGVYLSANMYPVSSGSLVTSIFAVPKGSLTAATPSLSGMARFDANSGTGYSLQPVVDLDNTGNPTPLLSDYNLGGGQMKRCTITAIAAGGLSTSGGLISVPTGSNPPDAPQLGSANLIATNDTRLAASVVQSGGYLWAANCVAVSGRAAVRWYKIRESDNTLVQSGTIADASMSYYFPSIAADAVGNAVIGFTGSDASHYASAYAVAGQTVGGTTTFGSPLLTAAGAGSYYVTYGGTENRWGDYSATVADPGNPGVFWTFQEYASATNVWSIRISQIIVPEPASLGLLAGCGVALLWRRRR